MNKETLRMQMLAGLITESQYKEVNEEKYDLEKFTEENLELIKRYYLSKQMEDILSVNPSVDDVVENLTQVINIVKNVKDVGELYDMLENFGYDEIYSVGDIIKWNNN
jgi:hypothetical protein